MSKPLNYSLAEQLKDAEMYEEFCELMFATSTTYADLRVKLEEWSIFSSDGALSRFKASHRGPWAMERAKREHKEFLNQHGADMDEAERQLVAMRIFADAASPETPTALVLRMRDQHLGAAKLRIENEKLRHGEVKLQQAHKALAQKDEQIDMQKRKIEALEAQAAAATLAAERAKEKLKGGQMDDATREALMAEVDAIMLGKPKPVAA